MNAKNAAAKNTAAKNAAANNAAARALTDEICLRPLEEGDIDAAHGLSVAVGWPHRPADWRAVLEIGHGYCALDAIGRLVGTAMWWLMGETFATIGMVIVAPGLQGRGLGRSLTRAAIEAAPGVSLRLNATAAGLPLYQREGFRPLGGIEQYQGIARPKAAAGRGADGALRAVAEADWPEMLALDRAAYGADRGDILRALTREAEGKVMVRNGRVMGFAFCRPFGRGLTIGPVIAPDEDAAIAIGGAFIAAHRDEFLRFDIPQGYPCLAASLEQAGLLPAGQATTMIKGRAARRSTRVKVFGLVNQAIG